MSLELDLYIEIDGEFMDEKYRKRMNEKIKYHRDNNINCKIILASEVFKMKDFI